MRRLFLWAGIGLLIGLAVVGFVIYNQPYTYHGSVIQTPFPAPDFTLADGKGGTFHLASQKGRIVLVFFGFTNCADVCPNTMSELKQVRERLGKDADKLQVVFITVDPGRDTPDRTAKYAAGFDATFVGLSGTEQQLDPVWQGYGVYHKLDKTSPTDTNYEVEHSTQVYVIDQNGNLRMTFPYGMSADDVLQDVRHLITKG